MVWKGTLKNPPSSDSLTNMKTSPQDKQLYPSFKENTKKPLVNSIPKKASSIISKAVTHTHLFPKCLHT